MNRILVCIIFFLFITTGYISFLLQERQEGLQKLNNYKDSWSVSQMTSEYFRLESWIGRYSSNKHSVTIDDVRMRLEIMLSQSELLKEGDLGDYIKSNTDHEILANQLFVTLDFLDHHLESMKRPELSAYLEKMHQLDSLLSKLSSSALTKDFNTIHDTNINIQKLYHIYSAISVIMFILSGVLGILIVYQNRKLLKTHLKVKNLANELQNSKEILQHQNTKLAYDAYHDSLTGLKNRLYFWNELKQLITCSNHSDNSVTVMLFDLDRFKEVNDSLGHDAGDLLLRDVARRLSTVIPEPATVYRLGGDEFALLSSALTESNAIGLASEICEYINKPYTINNTTVTIGTCVGIVVSELERRTDYLYKFADLALYEAKYKGSNNIKVFRRNMLQKLEDSRTLEQDLSKAVIKNELVVYYQPIVDSYTTQIYAYEALLYWNHPLKGLIHSDDFIPVAERNSLIHDIGRATLQILCKEATTWNVPARVSVNISPLQLNSLEFVNTVRAVLAETGLPATRLELEVKESSLFTESETQMETLIALRLMGIKISIDDFGTGYSSLFRLIQLGFDKIKIDKTFVQTISTDEDTADIVKLMIEIVKCLDMIIIAEGVETNEQLECLQRLGCDLAQGYLFGQPAPLIHEEIKAGHTLI
ncbi:EAL domain-containing protein [Enterobacter kobei]|nr:EAL domain-containing protein [Enterobacter kobei]